MFEYIGMRALLLSLILATTSMAAELRVSAAASLTDALTEIAAAYEQKTGTQIVLNFGASSALARQIVEGAPVDVFVSADELRVDQLAQRKLIGMRRTILSNRLVVVVPGDSRLRIRASHDLALANTVALAEPQTVPAGIYAKQWLQKTGVWPAVMTKVVPLENVRAALAAVEAGNADVAIVYKTDALSSREVRIEYEVLDGPRISYPAAVIATTTERGRAEEFVRYLASDAAKSIWKKHGFLLP